MVTYRPPFVFLENVAPIKKQIDAIMAAFCDAGYSACAFEYSPHEFGIPQTRKRVYIIASTALTAEELKSIEGVMNLFKVFQEMFPFSAFMLDDDDELIMRMVHIQSF